MIEWDEDDNGKVIDYLREDGRLENRGKDDGINYIKIDEKITGLIIHNKPIGKDREDKIFNLIDLEHLEIVSCDFKLVPTKISRLKKLEKLNLSQNNLEKIPTELVKLPNLKSLNVFKNQGLIVDEKIFELEKLEVLNLGFTNVKKIVDNISNFSHLKNLDLSGTNIEQIPMALFSLKKLEKLSLESNQIKEIPDDIEKLKALQTVDLRFNNIDKISKKIFDLNLSELLLENNPFLSIKELQNTNVEDMLNRLFQFHDNEFKKIDLSNLGIDYIPTLSQFKDIEILDLSNNKIKDISNDIFELFKLKELNLSSNSIKTISDDLLSLELENLDLNNNDVSQIKGFSLNKSPKEIIEFLLLNQDKETTSLNEAKILVLGDENSGKSSLVERMLYDRFNEDYNSTRAIDILGYKLNDNIKVNIWDFAGQEVTYQVHNLFMSKESLYLLVIDGQKENNIRENIDWLETINSNAYNPPIIIVVTKHESNSAYKIDEKIYKDEFRNVADICYVSSKENIGFKELKNSIQLHLGKLQSINKKIPIESIKIKRCIEIIAKKAKKKEDFNSYILDAKCFMEICNRYNISERVEQKNLRIILNDIGTIISLPNDDKYIINPSWIIKIIYEIIRSNNINDEGVLDINNLDSIVQNNNYTDGDYHWVIKFLKKNNIVLDIDDSTIMIPSRLDVNSPDSFLKENYMKVDTEYGLNFRYRYKRRFRKSILFDFIIQMQEYMVEDEVKYWANGVFLSYKGITAVVLSSKIDKTIDIHLPINNIESRELLAEIRKKIDEINKNAWNSDDDWNIIKEIAIVKDNRLLRYKNYKFLKFVKENGATEVELDIWGEAVKFKLFDLLDRYEEVETELNCIETFFKKFEDFKKDYNLAINNKDDFERIANSCGTQARKMAESFCRCIILNSNKSDEDKVTDTKGNLFDIIKKLTRDDTPYFTDKEARKDFKRRLTSIREIGNIASHDSDKKITDIDLSEINNSLLFLSNYLKKMTILHT